MGKIICEVCGTAYQDSADICPICGYAQSEFILQEEDFLSDSPISSRGKDDIGDTEEYDEEVYSDSQTVVTDDDDDFDDYEEEPEGKASIAPSTVVIVLLVVIITLLLLAIGILFFGFYLPNQREQASATEPVETQAIVQEIVEETTTEPTIPCTSLVLTSGVTELTREGQYWLLHVTVLPEDTTDTLIFVSEDESVVTVNEHGRLTAVGEGETTVYIACGDKQIKCKVVVAFKEEETKPSEEAQGLEPDSVEHETLPEGLEAVTEATEAENTEEADKKDAEQTKPTEEAKEEPKEEASEGGIVLKLEKSDVSSTVKGVSFELKLACDLKPEDVTWLTMDSKIAIVKNGVVTTIGPGQTKIVAQYEDQQVECIVRCNF